MKGKAKFVDRVVKSPGIQVTSIQTISEDVDSKPSETNSIPREILVKAALKKSSVHRQESVDFETAISTAGYGKFNYFLLLVAIPVTLSSGMVSGSVSLVLPAVGCDFQLTKSEKGLLQISPYIGMILFASVWGSLSDSFGRKNLLSYGFILDGLAGLGASLAPTAGLMILCKFLSGALNSGPFSIFSAYLSETFLLKHRDSALLACGIFSAVGNILQPTLGLLFMYYASFEPVTVFGGYQFVPWRLFLITCSLPSLVCGICSAFFLESPKFLLEKGRKEEALKVFKTIYSLNTGRPVTSYPVRSLHDLRSQSVIETAKTQINPTLWQRVAAGFLLSLRLFKKPYIGRAVYYFALQFGAMAGLNSFRLWLPQIFTLTEGATSLNSTTSGGLCDLLVATSSSSVVCTSPPETYVNMLIVNCGLMVSTPLFLISVHYFSKKVPIVVCLLVPPFFVFAIPSVPVSWVVYMATIFLSLLQVSFYALLASVVETFPTAIRATSVATIQAFGRIGVLSTNYIFGVFVFDYCNVVLYAIATLMSVNAVIAILLPTTPIKLPVRGDKTPKPMEPSLPK